MALDVFEARLLQLMNFKELPISNALVKWVFRLSGGVDAEWLNDAKPKAS